jgi:hypothetical protein
MCISPLYGIYPTNYSISYVHVSRAHFGFEVGAGLGGILIPSIVLPAI